MAPIFASSTIKGFTAKDKEDREYFFGHALNQQSVPLCSLLKTHLEIGRNILTHGDVVQWVDRCLKHQACPWDVS